LHFAELAITATVSVPGYLLVDPWGSAQPRNSAEIHTFMIQQILSKSSSSFFKKLRWFECTFSFWNHCPHPFCLEESEEP
jgi:hypothetical protein